MSMAICEKCNGLFDTDYDCDGMQDGDVICEGCFYNE